MQQACTNGRRHHSRRGDVRRYPRIHRGRTGARPAGRGRSGSTTPFATLVDIVDRNGGIVNKFLGDGFLALFGAPLPDPDAALRCGDGRRAKCSRRWSARTADTNGRCGIGIGIHFGDVVAGNVGSPRRKEYTVIGDTVNCASRIETLNKEFGSQILVSDAVAQALGETHRPCDGARRRGNSRLRRADADLAVGVAQIEGTRVMTIGTIRIETSRRRNEFDQRRHGDAHVRRARVFRRVVADAAAAAHEQHPDRAQLAHRLPVMAGA